MRHGQLYLLSSEERASVKTASAIALQVASVCQRGVALYTSCTSHFHTIVLPHPCLTPT